MSGPEHYREAERLLGLAQDEAADLLSNIAEKSPAVLDAAARIHGNLFTAAQVHATLALAAATDPMVQHVVTPYDNKGATR